MEINPYSQGLNAGKANYAPLTPLGFLERAAAVYPNKTAIIHGSLRRSYAEFSQRCRSLAAALKNHGVEPGDTVSVLAPNVPMLLEAHYGVPMAGAVLNAINIRLDPATISFILEHSEAKIFIVDTEFAETAAAALKLMKAPPPFVVESWDPLYIGTSPRLSDIEYETFLLKGRPSSFTWPDDEWRAIALNYTSGTTGNPKGVVYHHRGAYLNSLGDILAFGLNAETVYLWTLPMFHCNGWSFTWAVTAVAGTHVCLRKVDPKQIFAAIQDHQVTHFCGAPIVLTMLIHAPEAENIRLSRPVEIATGGAAPPSAVIAAMEKMGFQVTHLYGLTESYGPATLCAWQEEWKDLELDAKAGKMARQGVRYHTLDGLSVFDSTTDNVVPADGKTLGEIALRGNSIMKGYLKNPAATATAFRGGWFRTGDLGVIHPDGYVEIKDRSKDIIISGGENISSLEIEEVLYRHPAIMEAAVVAKSDATWGEMPCAFVTLKPGSTMDAAEIIAFCRKNMAHFKVPKAIVFGSLPKTSTGKIQKFILRDRANARSNKEL